MKKTQKRKNNLTAIYFIGICLLATFLRFYRIEENFYFSAEIGHNMLAIKNAYFSNTIPLIGPPTSHSWLYFGPLYYWLFGPVLILNNFNPIIHAYFGAAISVAIVVLHFFVVKHIFSSRVALLSSFLISISPLYMQFTRHARFFFIVALLIYPFIFFLWKVLHGNKKYLYPLWFVFGCFFNFHFSPLMLFPFVAIMFYYKKIHLTSKEIIFSIISFIAPLSPFFYYDLTHKGTMIKNVILWIPYRILGFFGIYPKNTISSEVVKENTMSVIDFVNSSFLPIKNDLFALLFFGILTTIFFLFIVRFIKSKKKSFALLVFLLWFFWGVVAIFIHGSPPMHYFLPIFPLPIVFMAVFFDYLAKSSWGRVLRFFVFLLFFLINMRYYFSQRWFYYVPPERNWATYDVPFVLQEKVTRFIIRKSDNKDYVLKRVGSNDKFEGNYAQNYQYLLWLYGNEPKNAANETFTIYETDPPLNKKGISTIEGISIVLDEGK